MSGVWAVYQIEDNALTMVRYVCEGEGFERKFSDKTVSVDYGVDSAAGATNLLIGWGNGGC